MKYDNIKKAHISRAEIAKAFEFKNRHSFNSTSANKRYMKGVNEIIGLVELKGNFTGNHH